MGEIIGGTVIQRSFVGREAANIIHIATVPASELGISSEEPEHILAEVLGIPVSNVLDGEDYRRVIDRLRDFPPDYFFPYWGHPRFHRYADLGEIDSNVQNGHGLPLPSELMRALHFPSSWHSLPASASQRARDGGSPFLSPVRLSAAPAGLKRGFRSIPSLCI